MANRLPIQLKARSRRIAAFLPVGITTYRMAKDDAWIRFYTTRIQ